MFLIAVMAAILILAGLVKSAKSVPTGREQAQAIRDWARNGPKGPDLITAARIQSLNEQYPNLHVRFRKSVRGKRIGTWVIGTIVAGLLPLIAHGEPEEAAANGELIVISIVILIAGIGELVVHFKEIEKETGAVLLLMTNVVALVALGFSYNSLLNSIEKQSGGAEKTMVVSSIIAYGVTGLITCLCVSLAAGAEQ